MQEVAHRDDAPAPALSLVPVPARALVCQYQSYNRRIAAVAGGLCVVNVKLPQPMDTDIDTASGAAELGLASVGPALVVRTSMTSALTGVGCTLTDDTMTIESMTAGCKTGDTLTGCTSIVDTSTGFASGRAVVGVASRAFGGTMIGN